MWKKLLAGAMVLVLLAAGGLVWLNRRVPPPDVVATPAPIDAGELLTADARVIPVRSAALSFPVDGIVAEVLVAEGQQVQPGQALVRLDTAHQRAQVASAQAALDEARASYELLRAGATDFELDAAEAQLQQAEAQLRQVAASVNPADLRAAAAQLEQARALVARLAAGPNTNERRAAEAQLEQARAGLDQARVQLSGAKTSAESQLRQAAEALIQAQTAYSTARWHWEEAERTGNDPVNPRSPDPAAPGGSRPNHLNDAQLQQYKDAYLQAEARLHVAEEAVHQAQVAYDAARQTEITGLQAAEQQVAASEAGLVRLLAGAERDQLVAARAQVAAAEAGITRLKGEARSSTIEAAQAAVAVAQANLARVRAGTPERELGVARARIATAEATLAQAQLALVDTELQAPFAGVVAALDVRERERVAPGATIARVADLAVWAIETTDLTELNVAAVREGAPVVITFDALPGLRLPGHITRIRPFGESRQGDITYVVNITPDAYDARLRWNMTAAVTIRTA